VDMFLDRRFFMIAAAASLPLAASCGRPANARKLPPPGTTVSGESGLQTAVLAGGCFWGVQAVYSHVKGVRESVSGYSGGSVDNPSYEQVTTGRTGHAEAVRVTFDPAVISYGEILRIFFSVATDPTQLNMQYPDVGTQYRNEIFYTSAEQKRVAEAYIKELDESGLFRDPIVTKVTALDEFFLAEGYHQDYLFKNPNSTYIRMYDIPKIQDLAASFPERYSADPIRV
jgi:peptide-methionine (S)-S-oxide reductase